MDHGGVQPEQAARLSGLLNRGQDQVYEVEALEEVDVVGLAAAETPPQKKTKVSPVKRETDDVGAPIFYKDDKGVGDMWKGKVKSSAAPRLQKELTASIADDQMKLQEFIDKVTEAMNSQPSAVNAIVREGHVFLVTYSDNLSTIARCCSKPSAKAAASSKPKAASKAAAAAAIKRK